MKFVLTILYFLLQNVCCKIDYDEEGDIDESLNGLSQDDPVLVDAIKNYYLMSPASNKMPYKIKPANLNQPKIFGQFQQALLVDLFYNQSKTNGFFFEAGAYDGVIASNTLLFETRRNWTGLLVEANPDNYDALLQKGRKSYSIGNCLALKNTPEIVHFDATTIFGGIIQDGYVKPGDNIPSNDRENQKKLAEPTRRTIKMQCFPIYSMLLAVGNPVVDYMSLDIEGAEYGVLKSIPWDKVDIKIISLEITVSKLDETAEGIHVNHYSDIKKLLTEQNYTEVRADWHTPEKITIEAYYVKNDLAQKIDKKYWKDKDNEKQLVLQDYKKY